MTEFYKARFVSRRDILIHGNGASAVKETFNGRNGITEIRCHDGSTHTYLSDELVEISDALTLPEPKEVTS
ncbi:MAG: hypothetical protein ACRDPE_23505 [Solirubrobacterales bacterium]